MPTYRQYKKMIERNKGSEFMLRRLEDDIVASYRVGTITLEERNDLLDLIRKYLEEIGAKVEFRLVTFTSPEDVIRNIKSQWFKNIKGEWRTPTAYSLFGHEIDPIVRPTNGQWRAIVIVDGVEKDLGVYSDQFSAMDKIYEWIRDFWHSYEKGYKGHSSHSECDSCGVECLRKHEMEALTNPGKTDIFGRLIRERLYEKGIVEAVDWAENVADWIECCREAGGVPMFVTRYAGQRFKDPKHPGKYLVLGKCYAPEKPCPSMWFNNVPEEDVEKLERD